MRKFQQWLEAKYILPPGSSGDPYYDWENEIKRREKQTELGKKLGITPSQKELGLPISWEDKTLIGLDKSPEEAKQKLDLAGLHLVDVMKKQQESRRLVAELWRHYIVDCHRYGVKPLDHP